MDCLVTSQLCDVLIPWAFFFFFFLVIAPTLWVETRVLGCGGEEKISDNQELGSSSCPQLGSDAAPGAPTCRSLFFSVVSFQHLFIWLQIMIPLFNT